MSTTTHPITADPFVTTCKQCLSDEIMSYRFTSPVHVKYTIEDTELFDKQNTYDELNFDEVDFDNIDLVGWE